MIMKSKIAIAFIAFVFASLLSGCGSTKNVAYFQDVDQLALDVSSIQNTWKVKPEDKLSIVVKSKDPELSELFNLSVATSRTGVVGINATNYESRNYTEGVSSYTVTTSGDIDFPVLGKLHVAGMTRSELAGFIKGELMGRELVKDPVVTVEFLNTGISVLGEVKNPGRYDINRDRLSVLDAIALAGDLNIQGQRKNVKVIRREEAGIRAYTIDLTNLRSTTQSPAFYLQQDDVVYIEPNSIKKRETTANGNTALSASFWVSVGSLLTSVAVLIFK